MNPNLYTRGQERVPSYVFLSTGTAPLHPVYNDPRRMAVNPTEYRKYEKIQEQVSKKKEKTTPPVSPTEAPILLFQGSAKATQQPGVNFQELRKRQPAFK
jgi:hypothetical protein